jgi:hypothetical protein
VLAWPETSSWGPALTQTLTVVMWSAVLITVVSGVAYVRSAIRLLRQ